MKNILCFEGEWKFNTHKKPERFDLNSEPILRMLKEYHKCDAIYRHILTKEDLKLYIEYFNRNKREWNKIDIVYINGSLKFEITAKRLYAASQRVL